MKLSCVWACAFGCVWLLFALHALADPHPRVDRGDASIFAYLDARERVDVVSYAGKLDLAGKIQSALAANVGRRIYFPAGKYHLLSRIVVPTGVCIVGDGWAELPVADTGTVFVQDYDADKDPYGFLVEGTGACLSDLEIRQAQPAPREGWQPRRGPWAIYARADRYGERGGHRLTVDHVMLRDVYDGIRLQDVRGGFLHDIYGQPLHWGVYISGNGDEPHLADIHLGWTYWSGDRRVTRWRKSNGTAYLFGRVDNMQATSLFAFGQKTAIRFFFDTSHADGNYDGVSSATSLVNVDADDCEVCIAIEDNPEIAVTNLFVSPDPAVAGSTCVSSYGVVNPGANFGNLRLSVVNGTCRGASAAALQFAFVPSGPQLYSQYIKLIGIHVARIGSRAVALPAIRAAKGVVVRAPDITVDGDPKGDDLIRGGGTLER